MAPMGLGLTAGSPQESHAHKGWDHGTNQAGPPHRDPEAWEWTI